jgi:hypothetical protein
MDATTRPDDVDSHPDERAGGRAILAVSIVMYGLIVFTVAAALGLMWLDIIAGDVGELLLASR